VKASELISALQGLQWQHGDCDVMIEGGDYHGSWETSLKSMEYIKGYTHHHELSDSESNKDDSIIKLSYK
tara:strand:- start:2531 stop:2740 length:210 start_codon:yes stop_codon:yes gene_type:complete